MSATSSPNRVEFENAIPILRVADMRASLDFYIRILGFKKNWGGEGPAPGMASVSRDKSELMLCPGDQGQPGTWVWLGVGDVEILHAELAAAGAKIILPPTSFSWAMEIRVEDPDGHVLRFGSEPRGSRQ